MTDLAIALNTPDREKAIAWVKDLLPVHDLFKIGLPLYVQHGPEMVREIRNLGARVFLDLKLCDIPSVTAESASAAADLGPELLTVHAWGGPEMLAAAADAVGQRTRLLAVTVLTSVSADDLASLDLTPRMAAVQLAGWAHRSGAWGVVCSGQEVTQMKKMFRGIGLVVPGVRFPDEGTDDQERVETPGALAGVADYIVVGRPITGAPEPRKALARYLEALSGST